MTGYWTNFAKTGNRNSDSLPNWPKHDAVAAAYMDFFSEGPVAREGLRKQASNRRWRSRNEEAITNEESEPSLHRRASLALSRGTKQPVWTFAR